MDYIEIEESEKSTDHEMTTPHSHEYYELYFLLEGEREVFIDNKMFGPLNISDYAASNLGEYISLCKTGSYLINSPDT